MKFLFFSLLINCLGMTIVVFDRYAKKNHLECIKESNSFVGLLYGICQENHCYFLEQKLKDISAVFNFILKST